MTATEHSGDARSAQGADILGLGAQYLNGFLVFGVGGETAHSLAHLVI